MQKHLIIYFALVMAIGFAYCQENTGSISYSISKEEMQKSVDLFLLRCGSCHPVNPPPKNGPPLIGIANHYKVKFSDFHSFKDAVINFIENPSEEKSLMPEAISDFYLMFKMSVDREELEKITAMMWNLNAASEDLQKSFSGDTIAGVELGKGGRLFAEKCGACHSFEPPPRNGPPARGKTRNYMF